MSVSVNEAGLKEFVAAGTGAGSSGLMMGIVGRDRWLAAMEVVPFADGPEEVGIMVVEGVRDWDGELRVDVESKLR
jgi:hypothetical protein